MNIAAADQYQAVIDGNLDEYINGLRADLATGIDQAAALVTVTTMNKTNLSAETMLAAALMRLAKQEPPR